jgi:integrase
LATATKTEVAGEIGKTQQGQILDYAWRLKKRGLAESTIKQRTYWLNLLAKKGADINNVDSVETILATEAWKTGTKHELVRAYHSYAKTVGIAWEPIKVTHEPKQPFIPLESEINDLIAGCGRKTGTFLQCLKDTGARAGEIVKLRWTDINTQNSTIQINNPEKGSMSRTIKVSPKTIAMILAMPKKYGIQIFNQNQHAIQTTFSISRKRLAGKLSNPRLLQIHFHTLRHWKATMEYHKTRDMLHVKYLLGHKRIENTEIYAHLIEFENDDYHSATAKTLEEAKQLIDSGFEYVTDMEGVKLFRKRA